MPVIALAALLAQMTGAQEPPSLRGDMAPLLFCDVGPIHRTLLGQDWEIYGCSDHRSVVVSAPKGRLPAVCVTVLKADNLPEPMPCNDEPQTRALIAALRSYTPADWTAILTATKNTKQAHPDPDRSFDLLP